jgi:uncharacterized membrane protein YebE (DUF533 family)
VVFNFDQIIEALKTDPNMQSKAKTGAIAGAAGLAAGMMMGKSGHKMLGKAAKYGALAALGGLAYQAWQRSQAGSPSEPAAASPRLRGAARHRGALPAATR